MLDAIALSLFVSIQEAIDVAFHVVTDERWGTPASNAEAFELLRRNGVIEASLAEGLERMASLRNRIAHGYSTVDAERIWRELPDGLATLESFATAVEEWLESREA